MKNLFLSVALIISTVLAKAQVNSTIYNDLKVRNNFSQKFTIQNLTEFNTAMTEIYGYNKSLGNYPNLPNLSTIISSSTFSLNGVIRFNDLNRGASNIRRLGGPNSTILLNTLNKYKSILETAIDYADFKTQITTELNNTPNSLQISFYN